MECVTGLDVLILAAVALAAVGGFRRGLVIGALAFVGFAAGALLGLRLGEAFADGERTGTSAFLALVAGFVASGVLAGVGLRLRSRWARDVAMRRDGSRGRAGWGALAAFDRCFGAVLSAVVALGVAWLASAAALQPAVPKAVREAVSHSLLLARLDAALPPPDPILATLDRFNPLPRLRGPGVDVPAPPRGIAGDRDVRAARASVVRVLGTACGRATSGSGWVAARGIVVTNAHVVAGQQETQVQLSGEGRLLDAVATAIDQRNDVAVLRVAGLDAPILPMAPDAEAGTAVVMLGFPGDGAYRARPARLGATRTLLASRAPGRAPTPRSVTLFRAGVRPGDSGGPLVDRSGRVTATVFAARAERRPRTGFAVPNEPVRRVLDDADGRVGTGPCVDGRAAAG
jgi:S1-C subfamily serine protease